MGDDASDPIDHPRATQPLAGGPMKNIVKAPGLVFVTVAAVAFVICFVSFAVRQVGVGLGAVIVALLAAGAALAWLTMEGRRVRQVQRDWTRTRHDVG